MSAQHTDINTHAHEQRDRRTLPETGSKKIFFNTSRCSTTSMSSVPNTSSGHTSLVRYVHSLHTQTDIQIHTQLHMHTQTRTYRQTNRHTHTHLAALTRAIHSGYFPSLSNSRVLAIAENLTRCIHYKMPQ